MVSIKRIFAFLLTLVLCNGIKAQLQITPQTNAQQLAQRLVGDGIVISNVTLTANALSTGFFKNVGGTQLNIDSGIVLSTGRVLTSGTNYGVDGASNLLASNGLGSPGDAQLTALAGQTTNDAAILEFDFIPLGDTVKFKYVFSSDEYPTFNCSSFNDVFAFYISGPGITGSKNIALIPGTNIPVSINSVNDGSVTSTICTGIDAGSPFTSLYVTNTSQYLTHNGHTKVFTAQSVVTPCLTYHLKIAIADAFDAIYDSGVFLQAKSLNSTPVNIVNNTPLSGGLPYMVEGCTNGSITLKRPKKLPQALPLTLVFTGTAQNGVDIQTIPSTVTIPANDSTVTIPIIPIADNITEGIETFNIYVTSGCSASGYFLDSLKFRVYDQVSASMTVTNATCTGTGQVVLNPPATAGIGAPYTYALNSGTFQTSNTITGLNAGSYAVTVKDASGCTYNTVVTVPLTNNLTLQTNVDTTICLGGRFTARANSAATSYNWTPSFGLSATNIPNPVITVDRTRTYSVTASLGNCSVTKSFTVTTFPGVTVNAGPDQTIIAGDQIQLQATATQGTYLWTPSAGLSATNILNPLATPAQTTTYTLTTTTPQGCTGSDDVLITVLPYCVKPMEMFSPNGDGINDLWLVTTGNCLKSAKAEVFNRYGARVFVSENYKNDWNGTYKGKAVADGTYYFVITYQLINGKLVYLKGNVTILR